MGATIRRAEVNGQPGAMFLAPDGSLMYVVTVDVADGVVQTVRSVIARDKLRHLGPLADVRAMLHARQES
jgi:RNA polymerase sigma-70 factor (ECF subfamily)